MTHATTARIPKGDLTVSLILLKFSHTWWTVAMPKSCVAHKHTRGQSLPLDT